jgi:hypothetical protein
MKISISLILIFFTIAFSQQHPGKYPYPVVGDGQTAIVLPATQDTFWVLKHSQYIKALANTEKLQLTEQELTALKRKLELSGTIFQLKDSIIDSLRFGYNHYKERWLQTDIKLEEAEIRASHNWMYFVGGTLSGAILTYLFVND